jgi:hypothetical protein
LQRWSARCTSALPRAYSSEFEQVRLYWNLYGGFHAIRSSPYLLAALVVTLICARFWIVDQWWEAVLATLPNIVGFSLSGYAIFLAFGDEKFRRLLAGSDPANLVADKSPYLEFSTSFMHFIVIQISAILMAVLCKAHPLAWAQLDHYFPMGISVAAGIVHAFGFLLFAYALTSAIAATIAIFRMVRLYDESVFYDKGPVKPTSSSVQSAAASEPTQK